MVYAKLSIEDFCNKLSSAEPVPGGGGGAALAGALAVSLGEMVANLTRGKKKYAAVENEVCVAAEKLSAARTALLQAIDADAMAFSPLAAAYRLPEGAEKEAAMEQALLTAAEAPLAAMRAMADAVEPVRFLAEHGSRLAVSDAGAAAALLAGSLNAASLNVFINAASMKNVSQAAEYRARADALLKNVPRAEEIYTLVLDKLKGEGSL